MKEPPADRPHPEGKPLGVHWMSLLALAVGLIAGGGAVGFRYLIGLFHNLLFLGELSFIYNANSHTPPSPWGAWVILVPVLGALGVAFLVKNFAPEAKGHGVPEVMEAIYYERGRIRPVVAAVKSVASALSIGSGGSVGREGPIAQIGAAFGSGLGQIVRMPTSQRVALVAAGAGGGIAATFNTPVGGFVFAIELMLPAINAASLLPLAVATMTATYIGREALGLQPAFIVPQLALQEMHLVNPAAFLLFALLGVLVGALAALFVRAIYWFEDRFEDIPGGYYVRHGLGMLAVGLTMYALLALTGHYYVQGVGYAGIEDVLLGRLQLPAFLLLLAALKLLATSLTLGSGASGGVFSPSLFLGAMLGGSFGMAVSHVFPDLGVSVPAFAIVGMAGMVAGATGAVMTAIIMLFEMTRDYNVIIPVVLTVGVANFTRKRLSSPSIYTLKLLRRKRVVPEGLEAAHESARTVDNLMSGHVVVLPADAPAERWPPSTDGGAPAVVLLERDGQVVGVLTERPVGEGPLGEALGSTRSDHRFIFVQPELSQRELTAEMLEHDATVALVTRQKGAESPEAVLGVVTRAQLAEAVRAVNRLLR